LRLGAADIDTGSNSDSIIYLSAFPQSDILHFLPSVLPYRRHSATRHSGENIMNGSAINAVVCNNMVTPYTNRLFNYLAECGVLDLHVVSCTLREENRHWSGHYTKSYDHIILEGIQRKLDGARFIHINIGIWQTLSRLKPQIVGVNGIYPTMLIAALWSFVNRVPLVFLTDGWRLTMPQSILHRIVRPFVIDRCCAIICASEKGRRFFIEEGAEPERIFVAHIAPAWAPPAELPDFDHRPYHLLWCGHFDDSIKYPSFFVDLAVLLKERLGDLRVRIVGDGMLRQNSLDRLSREGVNFDYTPYIPPDEISKAFATARMLVMPSKKESWGLVCNEAMQCGTPCAVSPYTGVADELVVNGRSGFVLDLKLDLWADAIMKIINNRTSWTALSRSAVQSVGRYDLECFGDRYLEGLIFAARGMGGCPRAL
jgi:glycosyltransferase involved in cell wall biosynthesis